MFQDLLNSFGNLKERNLQPNAPAISKPGFLPETEGQEVKNLSLPLEKKKLQKAGRAT